MKKSSKQSKKSMQKKVPKAKQKSGMKGQSKDMNGAANKKKVAAAADQMFGG